MNSHILLKSDERTNPEYGCTPKERPIRQHLENGVVNIDKPPGPTSHQVSDWVKKMLELKKAGHLPMQFLVEVLATFEPLCLQDMRTPD